MKTSEKAIIALAFLELICLLRVPWRQKQLQQRACVDSRMQSTSVARLSASYILAGDYHSLAPAHQLAIPRMRSAPRVCTLVLFISAAPKGIERILHDPSVSKLSISYILTASFLFS